MSIEAELRAEFDRWERNEKVFFAVLPYVLLSICTLITLVLPFWDVSLNVPLVLGLTAALALWTAGFQAHPRWRHSGPLTGLYYVGLIVLGASVVALAPWYGIFTFIGYVHAFLFLKGAWRYAGVAATAVIQAASSTGGLSDATVDEWLVLSLVIIVLAGAFFRFAELDDRRNHRQKRALTELHEANVKLESALAENAGLHAQLLVQAREAGVRDERQRMAREIHDTLAQGLAGILTQLQAAEQHADRAEAWRRHVDNAKNLARDSLTEARRTVHAVQPDVLAEARLPEAISDVTRRWSQVHRIDAVLTTTGDPRPMHADVEVTLLRAAQEALANVAKHARASRVGLTLSYMEDLVTLDVRDDGVGFEPGARRADSAGDGGFGLAGMRQRVQRLSGRLDIESEPGGGTAISATVPAIPAGAGS
ncbi:sensor histidine kinase [Micromonospora sp. C32]|uniref:sensor histidine kinase n=1 Tax=unclassified Micromonospora TaxID=2617518 RepID=UPI0027DD609D|nr:sensor histidine kinase [Micromonospora sp. C32]